MGALVCSRLKEIYYPKIHWQKCYKEIGLLFTELKLKVQIYYSNEDKLVTIKRIIQMNDDEIKDLLD